MIQSVVHIALVVRDYDEAIDFYTNKLHFELIEDTYQTGLMSIFWTQKVKLFLCCTSSH